MRKINLLCTQAIDDQKKIIPAEPKLPPLKYKSTQILTDIANF